MNQDHYIIIGTAGHVDHGKTLLTAALTGIDTDRLPEEKRRGMTIVPGFVPLDLKSGRRLGLIDVPGHEKFVKNMLAGVAGIDMVMLVVAANEGVMPQTVEHLNILHLLGIDKGVVVITKLDTVDEEMIKIVKTQVEELLAPTLLRNAPIVAVSAATGQNIEELRHVLDTVAAEVSGKPANGYCRIPVDRVFTKTGFGTIVTGTLWMGRIKSGQKLQLLPQNSELRVRGLQVHGKNVEEAKAGQRTAINLVGSDTDKIACGSWLAQVGLLKETYRIDVFLTSLGSAKTLSHRTRVRVHHGTTEALARINLLDREELKPGACCFAQLIMETPLPPLKGDRLVLRSYSPTYTIGGATVVDPFPKRHKRFDAQILLQLARKNTQDQHESVTDVLRQSQKPLSSAEIAHAAQLTPAEVEQYLATQIQENRIIQMQIDHESYYLLPEQQENLLKISLDLIADYHQRYPLRKGVPLPELRQPIFPDYHVRQLSILLDQWQQAGKIIINGATISKADFSNHPNPKQEQGLFQIIQAYEKGKFTPPEWKAVIQELAITQTDATEYLLWLTENGKLIKAGSLYYSTNAILKAQALLRKLFLNHDFTIGEARDALAVSRKYAQTILEYLDAQKITIRVGDTRHFLK